MQTFSEYSRVHWDYNFQNGSQLGSVWVHFLTPFYTFRSMKCDSRVSFSARTFISFYLSHEPKARVTITRLWLVVMPFICSFCIAHFTYTSMLHFHASLIQPSTSNIFTCECEHGLNAFGTHLTRCPFVNY